MTVAAMITRDRLQAALDSLDTKYRIDDDGEFLGWWGDNLVMGFSIVGSQNDILQINGWWAPRPPATLLPRLIDVCNAWNAKKRWPKVYAINTGDDLRLGAELNIDCEGDVTDAWIVQQITCAVGTTNQFCDELEELYPEHVAWLPEG